MHTEWAMAAVQMPSESVPTAELLRQTLDEARKLVTLEVRIAREELKQDLVEAKRAAIAGALALGMALLVLGALVVALILALGGTAGAALSVAAALAALTAFSVAFAYSAAPKSLLGKTRQHLKEDANEIKEHVA